jgi:hypothetical protein
VSLLDDFFKIVAVGPAFFVSAANRSALQAMASREV